MITQLIKTKTNNDEGIQITTCSDLLRALEWAAFDFPTAWMPMAASIHSKNSKTTRDSQNA